MSRSLRLLGILLMLLVCGSIIPPGRAGAQSGELCFVETGLCISGPIRDYWERNGGLPVFGYPISAQQTETVEGTWTGPVQWFERDRLEDHTNEGKGILAGRLGARWLELQGRPWQTLPGAPGPGDTSQCTFFAQTGHLLCGRFRTYWERNGGLERFGYPISEAFTEQVEGRDYLVQYFERRRMEYHPENAGTQYEVLLGLLGRDVRARESGAGWFFVPPPANAPLAPAKYMIGAAQRFEHGFMLWTQEPDTFYIFVENQPYWIVPAPYTFQPAPPVNETPPPGKYMPTSGFGRLWRGEFANLGPSPMPAPPRTLLGWAVEPEHSYSTSYQCQSARFYDEQRCYMNGPDGEVIWYGPAGWGRWP
jgi:hypothetical protein